MNVFALRFKMSHQRVLFHCCFLFLVLNLLSCRLNDNRIRGSYGPNPGSQDGSDSTPNPFEFTDQNDVALSSLTLSNIVQISGIDKKVDISISGDGNPEFRICLDVICTQEVQTWSSSPSFKKVENQYYLQIRQISSASYNTLALATLKLGTISASWQIQTLLAPVSPPVFSGWKQIQVGFSSCGIALNGKAYCWGLDNHGQLGENADGDNLLENTPTAVDTTALIPGTHFVSLTLGVWHTCGLTSNGQAYCWGWDVSGQLGENADGDNLDENIPVAVDTTNLTPGSSFVSLSAGDSHTCGLASDGKAYCWGLDNFGQLGENADGDNLNEIIPVAVDTSALTPGSSFVEISAGAGHTCGLSSDGKAFCWGLDDHGQLGENADGDNLPENIPVLVDTSALTAGSNFVAIKLGLSHSCGLASDGKAFCWGRDNNGQLGENADGDNLDENIPVAIDISNLDPGSNFISLQTGAYHTCGLTDNHKAYCWGSDGDGQLGENADGDNLDENIPVAVDTSPLAAGTQFVSLSLSEASSHSCGIASDSKAYCWGWDAFGQLGEDADGDNLSENIPVLVDTTGLISAHTFIQIVTGAGHSCGISSSGTAYCWGWDSDGQLGEDADGDDLDENLPVEVNTSALTPGSTFISLWAGNFHTCGLASDGLAYCWGQDVYGQLGESIYNDNLDKGIPVAVDTSALTPGTRFVSLSTGSNHTCGLASNGRAYCWGWDNYGQLGENADGDNLDEAIPVAVDQSALTAGTGFISISAGSNHTCGLASDGKAFCWGWDIAGQLGENADGDNLNEVIPTEVDTSALTAGARFVQIEAGGNFSCGLSSDFLAYCWGQDADGQLGENADGDNLNEIIPVAVDNSPLNPGSHFVSLSVGSGSTCGLASDGQAYCWGSDNSGQLGENADGDDLDENIPVKVDTTNLTAGSHFIAISEPQGHTCGLTDDGNAYCWGSDLFGQLGEDADGDNLTEAIPVEVDLSNIH